MKDQAFSIRVGGEEVWKAVVNEEIVKADFQSKGAAEAAIEVERRRHEMFHAPNGGRHAQTENQLLN